MVKVKPRGILTRFEIDQMVNNLDNVRDKALIVMLYIFGFRISELINLRKGYDIQVYHDEAKVHMLKVIHKPMKKKPKGGIIDSRDLFLELDKLIYKDLILGYYALVIDGERLFPFTRVRAWQIVKKANPDAWCHLFRHTRATRFANADMPVYNLMQWFDWSDPSMAMRYVQKRPIRGVEQQIR